MRASSRRFGGVVILVLVVLLAAWSGAWTYLRQQTLARIDLELAALAGSGTSITCPDRSVGGWPFALAVTCRDAAVTLSDGTRLALPAATVGAGVDDWHGLTFSLRGPVEATLADGRRIETSLDSLRGRVAIADGKAEALTVTGDRVAARLLLGTGELAAVSAENLTADLALADGEGRLVVKLASSSVTLQGQSLMPLPADVDLEARLSDPLRALAGNDALPAWQAEGGKLTLDRFAMTMAGGGITASGTAGLGADGNLRAEIDTVANHLDAVAAAAGKTGVKITGPFAGLTMAYLFMGRNAADGGRSIVLTAEGGTLKANGKKLATVPGLF